MTSPDLADKIGEAIYQKINIEGTFTQSDISETIRAMLPKSTQAPAKANCSSFGDPKAIPPTPEQVTAYSASIGYPLDGSKWCDFYEAKGWSVGKTRMKNYQAAIRNWKSNRWGTNMLVEASKPAGKDYSKL